MGVDIAVLQETKLTGGIHTRSSSGYTIVASEAPGKKQGGIALCWKEDNEQFEIEGTKFWNAHVVSFQLVTGVDRFYVMGCYIPPGDISALDDVQRAWRAMPQGCTPLLMGDLNINLDIPRDAREMTIVDQCDDMDLVDMGDNFLQRPQRQQRGRQCIPRGHRWTWRMRRQGRWIQSRPDYFLAGEKSRRRFQRVQRRTPRGHDSDHRAVVATIYGGHSRLIQRYRRRRHRFPLTLPTMGPRTTMESAFEALKLECVPPKPRERAANSWISPATWKKVDNRAMHRRNGTLSQQMSRRKGREITAALKADRKQRAEDAASKIESLLAAGEIKEMWRTLQGWYRQAEEKGPKPCYLGMEVQTKERVELYTKVPSPGESIPINVDPFPIKDDTPTDEEIRETVRGLRNGRAGGASKIRAEDVKDWLRGVVLEETEAEGTEGAGNNWRLLVALIQAIWEEGVIPQQMRWMIVVLIPKGGGDYRGIGLLEPIWKVIEKIMDKRLQIVQFHDCLHGFLSGRGTGTATIEAKLAQQLAYIEQEALYGIFIDLRKAYDAMDRERCLEILAAYGVGPKMCRLIKHFWDTADLVCRAGGVYGTPFKAYRGVTQGGPFSPRIFNVMVDAVVREWIRQVLGDDEAKNGYGELVRQLLAIFYADDAFIAGRDPVQLQDAINILVELFERVGLRTNTTKTQVMTCIPGKIYTRWSKAVYSANRVGEPRREQLRKRVNCDICGKGLAAASLRNHLETQHDVYRSKVIDQDLIIDRPAVTYPAQQAVDGYYDCPVPDCEGGGKTKWKLREHFYNRHPMDLVCITGEGLYPPCTRCGIQTNPAVRGHWASEQCKKGTVVKVQREAAKKSALALRQPFTAYGVVLERVEVFKYLGRLMSFDDVDTQAMRSNLKKARRVWARLSRVLNRENASSRVCARFYIATVQAVLLFGSETWNITPTAMKRLEGFHIRAAYRMAVENRPRREPDGSWTYPSSEDVLKEVGLRNIDHYVEVRRQTIAKFVVNRPVFDFCVNAERLRGSSPRQFWWEQSMDLEEARVAAGAATVVGSDDGESDGEE